MTNLPQLTTGSKAYFDTNLECNPCRDEDMGAVVAVAIVDGVPMCHDCTCEELGLND